MEQKTLEKQKKPNNCTKENTKDNTNHINTQDNNTSDLVDFYLQPELIKMISQQIANQPHIDQNNIDKIKAALKNKTLTFDDLSLAKKIIELETGLIGIKK
jgi:anti-sigma28 factor (negative regulator of flagellin synthesis)